MMTTDVHDKFIAAMQQALHDHQLLVACNSCYFVFDATCKDRLVPGDPIPAGSHASLLPGEQHDIPARFASLVSLWNTTEAHVVM